MKKLLLPILVLFSITSKAQITQFSGFHLEGRDVTYIQVFYPEDTSNLKERVISQLRATTGITNINETKGEVTAEIKGLKIDYKKFGCSPMGVVMGLRGGMHGRLSVQFKDSLFRLLIQNMEFISDLNFDLGSVETNGGAIPIGDIIVRNRHDEFRGNNGNQKSMTCISMHFMDMLTLKKSATASEDW